MFSKRKQKAKREAQESDDYDGNSAKADYEDEGLLKVNIFINRFKIVSSSKCLFSCLSWIFTR